MIKILQTILQGIVMGIAEVIPGVSGSTLALIMGIYDDFINLIHEVSNLAKEIIKFAIRRSSFADVKKSWFEIDFHFGVFLLIGMGIAVAIFSHVFTYLIEEHPQETFGAFFGLVLASVVIPWQEMKNKSVSEVALIIVSFIAVFILLGLKPAESVTNPSLIFVFLGAAIAICAMVLPGVSGSFILLLIGLYDYVIGLVKHATKFEITLEGLMTIIVFILGLATGLLLFVRVIKWAFENYQSKILAILVGIMLGSVRTLYPFMDTTSAEKASEMNKILPWHSDNLFGVLLLIILAVGFVIMLKRYTNSVEELEKVSQDE